MEALKLLFTSEVGLFSLAVFAGLLAMIVYFVWLFAFAKDSSEAAATDRGVAKDSWTAEAG